MMLEKVSACEVLYYNQPLLLVLGVVLLLGAVVAFMNVAPPPSFLAGAVGIGVILIYFANRKHIVVITADSGARMTFETKGISSESVVSFINNIEKAKNQRLMTLGHQAVRVG
jgi:hypothetical protein